MYFNTLLFLAPVVLATSVVERQAACPPLEILHARGTGELGVLGIIGGPLGKGVAASIPGAIATGIDYPATDFFQSPQTGATWTVNYITKKAAQCPETKFAISGYSQGAMVVHRVAGKLSAELTAKVVAATVFGDPNRQAYGAFTGGTKFPVADQKADVYSACGSSDTICGPDSKGPANGHIGYSTAPASAFIVARYKAKAGGAEQPAGTPVETAPVAETPAASGVTSGLGSASSWMSWLGGSGSTEDSGSSWLSGLMGGSKN